MKKNHLEFRNLYANEIECRFAQVGKTFMTLLLYKDARCDMNILDETVGAFNWKREHLRDNANCVVSIYNEELGQWISKEDTGTQSFTEKEKGLASDSFKRACFNWGIGRELYTAPFIKIQPNSDSEIKWNEQTKKGKCWTQFKVNEIEYKDKIISYLEITDRNGAVRFKYGMPSLITEEQLVLINASKLPSDLMNKWLKYFKVDELDHITQKQAQFMLMKLGEKK